MNKSELLAKLLVKYDDIKGNEEAIGKTLAETADSIDRIKAVELILTGTEFNTRLIFEELGKCKESVVVFGGYAGGCA